MIRLYIIHKYPCIYKNTRTPDSIPPVVESKRKWHYPHTHIRTRTKHTHTWFDLASCHVSSVKRSFVRYTHTPSHTFVQYTHEVLCAIWAYTILSAICAGSFAPYMHTRLHSIRVIDHTRLCYIRIKNFAAYMHTPSFVPSAHVPHAGKSEIWEHSDRRYTHKYTHVHEHTHTHLIQFCKLLSE